MNKVLQKNLSLNLLKRETRNRESELSQVFLIGKNLHWMPKPLRKEDIWQEELSLKDWTCCHFPERIRFFHNLARSNPASVLASKKGNRSQGQSKVTTFSANSSHHFSADFDLFRASREATEVTIIVKTSCQGFKSFSNQKIRV